MSTVNVTCSVCKTEYTKDVTSFEEVQALMDGYNMCPDCKGAQMQWYESEWEKEK